MAGSRHHGRKVRSWLSDSDVGRERGLKTTGCRRRMSMFVAGIEIKPSDKHVEAASDVVSGLGFKSPRLHSTRCARSWQAGFRAKIGFEGEKSFRRKEAASRTGFKHVRICASGFLFRLHPSVRRWEFVCRAHVQRRRAVQGPQRWTRCALDCLSKTCDISAPGVPAIRREGHCTRATDQAMDTCKKTRAYGRREDTIENTFETANAITPPRLWPDWQMGLTCPQNDRRN